MKGKFNLLYAITGKNPEDPNQPISEDWNKAAGNLIKITIILVVLFLLVVGAFGVKNMFFPKATNNINKPIFNNPGHVDYSVVQIGQTKRPNINVMPYIDLSAGTRSDKYWNGDSTDLEARVGIRFEMDGLFQTLFGKKEASTQEVASAIAQANTMQNIKDQTTK